MNYLALKTQKKKKNEEKLKDETLAYYFRSLCPQYLALLILGLWCSRTSWKQEYVAKNAAPECSGNKGKSKYNFQKSTSSSEPLPSGRPFW